MRVKCILNTFIKTSLRFCVEFSAFGFKVSDMCCNNFKQFVFSKKSTWESKDPKFHAKFKSLNDNQFFAHNVLSVNIFAIFFYSYETVFFTHMKSSVSFDTFSRYPFSIRS